MNTKFIHLLTAATVLLVAGCATRHDQGPYAPQTSAAPALENSAPVVLMDPGVQYSVTCTGLQEGTTADGRLKVTAQIRNRENRRIEVQDRQRPRRAA